MPRSKSDITDGVTVTVRLSPSNHLTFLKLGSVAWLRAYLGEAKDREDELKQLQEFKDAKRIRGDR